MYHSLNHALFSSCEKSTHKLISMSLQMFFGLVFFLPQVLRVFTLWLHFFEESEFHQAFPGVGNKFPSSS